MLRMRSIVTIETQHQIGKACTGTKKQLRKKYVEKWLKARNNGTESFRKKLTYKELIKKKYQLEEYLMICRNPANGISHTKLRLGVHHSRIQTGKYEITEEHKPSTGRDLALCFYLFTPHWFVVVVLLFSVFYYFTL